MSVPDDRTEQPSPSSRPPGLVVIGNFDGVHRGHHYVLARAAERAEREGLTLRVLTFDPHPRQVVTGGVVPVLTATGRKCTLLRQLGLDLEVDVLSFTSQTAQLSPEQFCEQILRDRMAARLVVVGQNFRFGRGRSGDLAILSRLGEQLGIVAMAEELQGDAVGTFSSTRVRDALAVGDVEAAAGVLGRPHLISGAVVVGDQRGRTLGFPTANLGGGPEVLPAEGVYAGFAYDLDRAGQFLAGCALNVGSRPTVGRPPTVEAHLLDFSEDIYGKNVGIELLARVRSVRKFDDVTALRAQIERDVEHTQQQLAGRDAPRSAPGYED